MSNVSSRLQKILEARTLKELSAIIAPICASVSQFDCNAPKTKSSLKLRTSLSAGSELEVGSMPLRPARPVPSARFDEVIDVSEIDTDSLASRAKAARNLALLSQALTELRVAYQLVRSQNLSRFKTSKETADSIAATIAEAETYYKKLVKASQAARTEVPKDHATRARSVANYLKSEIPESHRSAVKVADYVAAKVGPVINYQSFITVQDFTSSEGYSFDNYSIVLTASVNTDTGEVKNYITSLQDLRAPGSFDFGSEIRTKADLKSKINRLLSMDGSPLFGDRRPVGRSTTHMRNLTALGLKNIAVDGEGAMELLDGVRVSNNRIYVRLVEGLSDKERTTAIREAVAIVSSMYGTGMASNTSRKNAVAHRLLKGNAGREWLEFTILPSRGSREGSMTLARVNEVASLFGMDAKQKSQLLSALK